MWIFLINIILFIIGILLGIWYFSTVILSFFYGFPRALLCYFRKELRLKATLHYLGLFFGWQLGIILFFILIAIFLPSLSDWLQERSGALSFGSLIGFWLSVLSAIFGKKTRTSMASDFQDFVKPYIIDKSMKEKIKKII